MRISKAVETQRNIKLRQPAFGIQIKKPRGTEITEPKYEKRFHKVWLTCVHTVTHSLTLTLIRGPYLISTVTADGAESAPTEEVTCDM